MKLLLDTHVWLWMATASSRLRPRTRRLLVDPANQLFLSAASAWEIAIKSGLGKVVARTSVGEAIADYGFDELSVCMTHADAVRRLPLHHRDPFDRMLVAQALVDGLTIVSRDPLLSAYTAPVVWT